MDPQQFKSTMHSLAFGEAMLAAARDYKKEVLDAENRGGPQHDEVDIDDLLDDPELEKLHAERLQAMQQEAERRAKLSHKGHGTYQEIEEGEFLEVVTKTDRVVCHFFHREFERCRIMDKHLGLLARNYFDTRFVKLCAPDAPFFTAKLGVRMLPCVVAFVNGVAVDRITGFDAFGGKDDFRTAAVEAFLRKCGALTVRKTSNDDEEEIEHEQRRNHSVVKSSNVNRYDSDDE